MSALSEIEDRRSALAPFPKRRGRLEFALPTINVIFLLMLYFLVAGTLVQKQEMEVVPPNTDLFSLERLPRPLLIVTENSLVLDGTPIDPSDLGSAAREALGRADTPAPSVNILAPADMNAAPFLEALGTLGAADLPVRVVTLGRNVRVQYGER